MNLLANKRVDNLLEQCAVIAKNSKCSRRKFGAIITSWDNVVLSTGWNGTVRGAINCGQDLNCLKDLFDVPSYQGYEMCPAVHAEENALINAAREGISIKHGILYLNSSEPGVAGMPCQRCTRDLINAGIEQVYYKDKSGKVVELDVKDMIKGENLWMEEQNHKGEQLKNVS